MNDKYHDILQQIAIDVAVIKSKMDRLEEADKKIETHSEELASMKTQLGVIKSIGSLIGAGLVGVLFKVFSNSH